MHNKRKYQTRLVVRMKYAPAHDADDRLCRVVDVLLKAGARGTSQAEDSQNIKKEEPPHQVLGEDALTGGGEEGDSHE